MGSGSYCVETTDDKDGSTVLLIIDRIGMNDLFLSCNHLTSLSEEVLPDCGVLLPGLSNAKSVDLLWWFGFLNRMPFRQYQAERNMPGTLIGEEKIEMRQVGRLYLMPFEFALMRRTDLDPTHQGKIYLRSVITMNKGGDIFVLGVNGQ